MADTLDDLLTDLEAKEVEAQDLFHDLTVAASRGTALEFVTAWRTWKVAHHVVGLAAARLALYKREGH